MGAWLGFANPLLHLPIAVLAFPLCLAWIGLRATSGINAFKFGWIAGLLAGVGNLYWLVIPVQIYGGLPWYVALPCPVLLSALMAIYYGLFSYILFHLGKRIEGGSLCILAGLAWASIEMLIGSMFSGFPWMNLASAFTPWPVFIQAASVVGAYGLSGLLAALSVALLLYSTYRCALFLSVGLAFLLVGFGFYRMDELSQAEPDYMIAVAQGNIDQSLKWEPKFQASTVKTYVELSLEAIQKSSPKVVIWPETSMPFYLQDRTPYRKALEIFAKDTKTSLVIGSPAYKVTDMKTRSYVLFNRAWLMDDLGRTTQYYDKEHLVPFGEYMPLEKLIPFEKLVHAAGDFIPGTDNTPLMLDGVALGMVICYEGIFPELAQKQVERGATALLNISNDAWFGDTSAPLQHLNLTIMRAVEQGRWLVRSTNTGISAFIDPTGTIRAVSSQFEAQVLSASIEPRSEKTIFHRHFSKIRYGVFVLTLLGIGLALFGQNRKRN